MNGEKAAGIVIGQRAVLKEARQRGALPAVPLTSGPGTALRERQAIVKAIEDRQRWQFEEGTRHAARLANRWIANGCPDRGRTVKELKKLPGGKRLIRALRSLAG
jgi:hypothetical protein